MSGVGAALACGDAPGLRPVVMECPAQADESSGDGACAKDEVTQASPDRSVLSMALGHRAVSAANS
jgi:hypothetical protein